MKYFLFFFAFIGCATTTPSYGQSYLDLVKISYLHNPGKGFNTKSNPLLSDLYSVNVTLPIELKKDGDAFVVNPFFDHNEGKISNNSFHVFSEGLSLGFLKKPEQKKWSLFSNFILRRNKQAEKKLNDGWQFGGVVLTTWNKRPGLSLRLGLYYNKEFFGNFFMPLAGIDWKIDEKNNLFGVLPGNLTLEHKVNNRFYWGSVFRAFTNSYLLETIDPCLSGDCSGKNYLRIDDNQFGVFADTYITTKIVFTSEAGYTILRRYRFGFRGDVIHHYSDLKSDNYYIKLLLAYRFRR
jgi:Domain of unknown function (DUF6268)